MQLNRIIRSTLGMLLSGPGSPAQQQPPQPVAAASPQPLGQPRPAWQPSQQAQLQGQHLSAAAQQPAQPEQQQPQQQQQQQLQHRLAVGTSASPVPGGLAMQPQPSGATPQATSVATPGAVPAAAAGAQRSGGGTASNVTVKELLDWLMPRLDANGQSEMVKAQVGADACICGAGRAGHCLRQDVNSDTNAAECVA